MYKNRIRGIRCWTSWPLTTKSISIKGIDCKFGVPRGDPVRKAVELTSGDLPLVRESGLRIGQPVLTGRQKSAEGVVGTEVLKARTVLRKQVDGSGK